MARAAEKLRYRVAFYGSTPAYRGVFDLHGVGELGETLQHATRQGAWDTMAAILTEELLVLLLDIETYRVLAPAIEKRFGGLVDTVSLDFLDSDPPELRAEVVKSVQAIPTVFKGYRTAWAA